MTSPSVHGFETLSSPRPAVRDGISRVIAATALATALAALAIAGAPRPAPSIGQSSPQLSVAAPALTSTQIAELRWRAMVTMPSSALRAHFLVAGR